MERAHVSRASVEIAASSADVWDALVTPATAKKYFFGADVHSDWRESSAITFTGAFNGRAYHEKGTILHELRTEETQVALPESVKLEEGRPYTWEVSARRSDGARYSSLGDFSIAPQALRERAVALRPAAGAPASEQAAYAMWLDGQGLTDAARAVWRQLALQRPDDPMLKSLAGP